MYAVPHTRAACSPPTSDIGTDDHFSSLETLTWSNESTFKFNDYPTQLINHYEILERDGQAKTDEEKLMKLLNLMSTSNVPLQTRIELNCQGVTFQIAIVSISTSISTIFF